MTTEDVQEFVTRFAAAWAARDGNAFLELWHPDGTLHTPLVERPIKGSELAKLMEVQTAARRTSSGNCWTGPRAAMSWSSNGRPRAM
jgi:hypothetical protein